jgi:Holliday junction resolvase RusA-like endonuclease
VTAIEYTLYGEPLPMPRPRVMRWGICKPSDAVRDLKARHREAAEGARPADWAMSADVAVHIGCFRKTRRACDVDNLAKLPMDALTGVAWNDDAQIVRLTIEKRMDREDPRTEVRVWRIEETQ